MASSNDPKSVAPSRARAEAIAKEKALCSGENLAKLSLDDIQRLLHELRVHEIELSMQNEELLQSQMHLGEARARYFDLYNLAPVGYCTIDKAGLIVEANLTFATLMGISRSELIMRPFHLCVERADRILEHEFRQRIFGTHNLQSLELRMTRPGGEQWWAHLEATAFQDSNRVDECRMVVSDVTERVRMAAERETLEARQNQARRLDSLGQLAGAVAHELNNMLSVVQGHVEIAVDKIDPENPLLLHLEEISKAAERAASLVRQLLNFAREQPVSPEILDLNVVVQGMMVFLQQLIGEGIRLHWHAHPDPLLVNMDRRQFEQALANLCMNARDSIADIGSVSIDSGRVELTAEHCASHVGARPCEYVWIGVSDSGRGMDADTLDRVFEPLFTVKDAGRGKGFGMASVYGSVRQAGGFIVAASEPGHGSSFTIHLPRHVQAAEQQPFGGADDDLKGGNETVLLIEDEKPVLDVVILMLQRLGYKVLATSDATDAFRLAAEHGGAIHMLITDVIMPEINGKDLATRLLTLYPGLRLLFMSGYPADIIARHGVLDSGIHFLQKPFSLADLRGKIREVLDEPG